MAKCRITVLKKTYDKSLAEKYFKKELLGLCDFFKEGDEFIVDQSLQCPKGFCGWAWNDISKPVTSLVFGGNFRQVNKDEKKFIACCTDGIRPVIFELSKIANLNLQTSVLSSALDSLFSDYVSAGIQYVTCVPIAQCGFNIKRWGSTLVYPFSKMI